MTIQFQKQAITVKKGKYGWNKSPWHKLINGKPLCQKTYRHDRVLNGRYFVTCKTCLNILRWQKWDWTLTNAELGRRHNLKGASVGWIRRKLESLKIPY